jgi:AraC-like DNA-binding protein
MDSGAVRWWTEDGSDDVVSGDAYIVRPGELHGGMLNTCTHYTLWLSAPGFGERYFELPSEEAAALASSLEHSPVRCAPVDQPLGPAFEALMELAEARQAGPDPLLAVEARALLLHILSRIGHAGRAAAERARSVPSFSAAVVKIIEESLGKPLSARQIAARMGCSVSQLQHRFHAEFGMTVKHFYLRLRINESCRRLEHTGDSITDIAYDLGFSSSQHFATTFRRFVGASPRAYRQGNRIPDRDEPWPDDGSSPRARHTYVQGPYNGDADLLHLPVRAEPAISQEAIS